MSPYFKDTMKIIIASLTLIVIGALLASCTTTTDILAGSDGACGTLHIEGSFTDSQGDVIIFKVPEGWTAEQVKDLCPQ
jgi:hypothetical protein